MKGSEITVAEYLLIRLKQIEVDHLFGVSDADIVKMNILAGIPRVYELDVDMKPIRFYYPGDAERVRKAMQTSANHVSLKNHREARL